MDTRRIQLWRSLFPLLAVLLLGYTGCHHQPPSIDPATLRDQAATTFEQAQSFHFVLTHNHGTTMLTSAMQLVQAEGDVVKPDQLHATLLVQLPGAQLHVQLIGVGDRTWMTNPFNPAQWQPLQNLRTQDVLNLTAIPQALRAMTNLHVTGRADRQGTALTIIEGQLPSQALKPVIPNGAENGHTLTVRLWIGTDDHRLYQVLLSGPFVQGEPSDIQRTLVLSNYDVPVTITPPAP